VELSGAGQFLHRGDARLDVISLDAMVCRPGQQRSADVFGPIVATNRERFAAPLDNLLQRSDDASRRQRQVDLDPQPFATKVVQDVEQPEASPVAELIMHEVH